MISTDHNYHLTTLQGIQKKLQIFCERTLQNTIIKMNKNAIHQFNYKCITEMILTISNFSKQVKLYQFSCTVELSYLLYD